MIFQNLILYFEQTQMSKFAKGNSEKNVKGNYKKINFFQMFTR